MGTLGPSFTRWLHRYDSDCPFKWRVEASIVYNALFRSSEATGESSASLCKMRKDAALVQIEYTNTRHSICSVLDLQNTILWRLSSHTTLLHILIPVLQ